MPVNPTCEASYNKRIEFDTKQQAYNFINRMGREATRHQEEKEEKKEIAVAQI